MTIDPLLSPLIMLGEIWLNPSLLYRFLSQHALCTTSDKMMYSASVDESVISICFFDFHVTAPPATKKTSLSMDLRSLAFVKAASAHPEKRLSALCLSWGMQ